MFSYGALLTDEQVLDDQLELIYNSSVRTQDVAWKTRRKLRTIETNGKRGSGKTVQAAWHDINDADVTIFNIIPCYI